MTTGKNDNVRNYSLCKTIAIVCAIALAPSPIESFRCLPPVAGSRRCDRSISSIHVPFGGNKSSPYFPEKVLSAPTALSVSPNRDDDANDEGVRTTKENDQLKETVGAIFIALLAAEFFLTPVLKPIILAARDSS
mmetsp:Transcript_26659/g.62618  ORF Transcript_26659/g.62618 Transcript_26659/m.62618 type:complete len:135 (+) Transcript_26659:10-414(+)